MDDDHGDGESGDDLDSQASGQSMYYDAVSTRSGEVTPRAVATDDVPVGLPSGSTSRRNPVRLGGPVDSRFELPTELAYSRTGVRDQQAQGSYTFSPAFQRTLHQRPSAIHLSPDVNMEPGLEDLEGNPWSDNVPVLRKRGNCDRTSPTPLNSSDDPQFLWVSRYSHSGSG